MKIYSIDLIISEENKKMDIEEMRSNVMSYFYHNVLIDAIATADITMHPCLVSFHFKEPVDIQ